MLRPYQKKALTVIYNDLKTQKNVLLSGMMGCGKTIMAVKLIERLLKENKKIRVLVLMHKKELINQFDQAFTKFTAIVSSAIGNCCAGINKKEINKQITIGSVQTFVNIKKKYKYADLLIVDECHRINMVPNNQYYKIISWLRAQRPGMRIFGITATPVRLGHGLIYGDRNKNLFSKLNHKISYKILKEEGYLVPLKGKIVTDKILKKDLKTVKHTTDYWINQLGEVMTKQVHLETAVKAVEKYTTQYKCVCIFCCTIDHAEKLNALIPEPSVLIHSKLSRLERQINMIKWTTGKIRIAISINILTEGFDLPMLDCILFARPTLSSTLFLQAIGRVLRIYPKKKHGFIIDLTDNTYRFGTDLDHINIAGADTIDEAAIAADPMFKICPECGTHCHTSLYKCGKCGFEWPSLQCVSIKKMPSLTDVDFSSQKQKIMSVWSKIDDWWIESHISAQNNKELGKIVYKYQFGKSVFVWLCFSDNYKGYAVKKSKEKWKILSDDPFPATVKEFLNADFNQPYKILIDYTQKYPQVKKFEMVPF